MRRSLIPALISVAAMAVAASASAGTHTSAFASASAFTIKDFRMNTEGNRLTYSLTICTPVKATLRLQGTFTPLHAGKRVRTAKPGSTQYQDTGCWPALVSTPVAKRAQPCPPVSCAAVKGIRYRGTVLVTDETTHQSQRAPRLRARA